MKSIDKVIAGIVFSAIALVTGVRAWLGYLVWMSYYGSTPTILLPQIAHYHYIMVSGLFGMLASIFGVIAFLCFLSAKLDSV